MLRVQARNIVREWICASGDLIADGSQHERESAEELCGAAVKLRNNSGHIPLEVAPDVLVCRSDKYWSQSTQGTDDWKREKLIVPGKSVLGEAAKIRHIDGHRRKQPQDGV